MNQHCSDPENGCGVVGLIVHTLLSWLFFILIVWKWGWHEIGIVFITSMLVLTAQKIGIIKN